MDIEEHLAEHEEKLRALAFQYGRYNRDLRDDCYQAGIEALINAHKRWRYHGAELLTYAWHDVKKAMLKQVKLVESELPYGITEELDALQEIAERQDRNRLHLDRLYDEPLEGLKTPLESTLSRDRKKLAQRITEGLTDDELAILDASVGRSLKKAALFLGMPYTTYHRKLGDAKAKALALAQG